MDIKNKITEAFNILTSSGYLANQNYYCCGRCGVYAMSERIKESEKEVKGFVFYHNQDNDNINQDNSLNNDLYLTWNGDGKEICDIINSVGLNTIWDGNETGRIGILKE